MSINTKKIWKWTWIIIGALIGTVFFIIKGIFSIILFFICGYEGGSSNSALDDYCARKAAKYL